MAREPRINVTFDFRTDTPPGRDPDTYSPTLRRYHRLLWSKPLPGGEQFDLTIDRPDAYLYHRSQLGEFFLASDTVIPSFSTDRRMVATLAALPAGRLERFHRLGYTIGGMMVFPGNSVDRKMTINGARGFHPLIKDRFDYTVECIRRHYSGLDNPLSEVLGRYADFFGLFRDFAGYVDFFHLQDIVSADHTSVKFFTRFEDFGGIPLPLAPAAYTSYLNAATAFINARNHRIARLVNGALRR